MTYGTNISKCIKCFEEFICTDEIKLICPECEQKSEEIDNSIDAIDMHSEYLEDYVNYIVEKLKNCHVQFDDFKTWCEKHC